MIKEILFQLYQLLIQICQGQKMNRNKTFKYIYQATIGVDDLCYVEREADRQLYEGLKDNEHTTICYVFNSRKMGKSSLEVRVRTKLKEDDDFICTFIDFNLKGSDKGSVTIEKWYFSIVKTIAQELNLNIYNEKNPSVLDQWWQEREKLTYPDKLTDLIAKILRDFPQNNILIVFDEIDTLLRLDFSTDDLFAFIRGCHNNRVNNPEYKRLHFCIVGTTTPSDLISDQSRTPFNVGKAIELRGFTLQEAILGLSEGLQDKVDNPNQVLEDILTWTNGQPFLTQKLCALAIEQGDRNPNIEELVQTQIINNWENPNVDAPEYLRTIRDRIIAKDEYIEKRLILYQQIWKSEENKEKFKPNQSKEQEQLCLSGLVINTGGRLKISNLICRTIFNIKWIEEQLNNLPPAYLKEYALNWESLQDESFLLTGQTLEDALKWEKKVGSSFAESFPLYSKFLEASKNAEIEARYAQKNKINDLQKNNLLSIRSQLLGKINHTGTQHIEIAKEISSWTNDSELILDKIICQSLSSESPIPEGTEREWVQQWIKTNIIDNYQNSPLATKIAEIMNSILDSDRYLWRLQTYQKILASEDADTIDENDVNALLVSGLVVKILDKLQVANRIYEGIFSQEWVKAYLPPYEQSFTSWQASSCQDEFLLLKGEDLQKALNWIQNKDKLSESELELEFIITSLVWEKWQSDEAVNKVKEFLPPLKKKTKTPAHLVRVIQAILEGTKPQLVLLEEVLQWVGEAEVIPTEDEAKWLEGVVRSHFRDCNAQQLAEYLDFKDTSNDFWRKLKDEYEDAFIIVDEFIYRQGQISPRNDKIEKIVDYYCNSSYDSINDHKYQQILSSFLHSKFSKAKSMIGQKEFDQLLDNIVKKAGGDLESILIFDLSEGLPLYHNRQLKSSNSQLYHALFGDGDDVGEAVQGFNDLLKIQSALNKFGEKTNCGDLTYSIFKLAEGSMMVFFIQVDIPMAICFIGTEGINIGNLRRHGVGNIAEIKEKLGSI